MVLSILKNLRKRIKIILFKKKSHNFQDKINDYINNGKIPWSEGYHEFKNNYIAKSINDLKLLQKINNRDPLVNYGYRLDERVIEYPWIFSKLPKYSGKLLDAGSTFNFDFIVNHPIVENKDLSILTYAPENNCFYKKRISYVFDDLRTLPFKNGLFDIIVSQSTIEHIDMDNSIYGYEIEHNENEKKKSYEYLKVIKEMIRVLKPKGKLLLTFPFGKFENHGFFQQFDEEMLMRIMNKLETKGTSEIDFFKYEQEGWQFKNISELRNVVSYNPHSGKGELNDGAAHCRSVACVHFIKNEL